MKSFGYPLRAAAAAIGMLLAASGVSYGAFQMVSSSEQPPSVTQTDPTASETPEATETETPEATATETPEATETETPEATATETPEATETETAEPEDGQGEHSGSKGETSDEGHATSPSHQGSHDSGEQSDSEDSED